VGIQKERIVKEVYCRFYRHLLLPEFGKPKQTDRWQVHNVHNNLIISMIKFNEDFIGIILNKKFICTAI